ncbi:YafY family protein [Selenomonas sp. oral taxon 138]|uniref:helix-turn-helix transcriptional regulator n=1 Tax=Selenomonas sp. oral taxon 138 TaxID=712532 RepID=UPI0002A3B0D4|nr:WYL domain-containing protein [Selenomonas sp. oral taxon 138]EKX95203.1 hypothetical protein HMPREF9163_02317 [Selenomonas sp. oral taxon 138 str. F0429]
MYASGSKKMLNMMILEILRTHTDEEHRLTQQEIIRLMKLMYGVTCDRRSVRSNIEALQEMGYEIEVRPGYALIDRTFDNAELRMLIDSVLFSHELSAVQANRLIEKLKSLGSRYFQPKVSHVAHLSKLHHAENAQVMHTLDVLNDAIEAKHKVQFTYNSCGTDFRLHPRRTAPYVVNPYQMAAQNGRYYLIGNYDAYDNVSHYRIDRITDIKMLDEPAKPKSAIRDFAQRFSLPRHMAEHIYMFSGESVTVQLRTYTYMMDALTGWFGRNFRLKLEDEERMLVTLRCNEEAMKYWALQFGIYVEIISPERLRTAVKDALRRMCEIYGLEAPPCSLKTKSN